MLSYVKTRRTQGTNAFLAREHATHINAQKELWNLRPQITVFRSFGYDFNIIILHTGHSYKPSYFYVLLKTFVIKINL
jgi:hypothetical protein